MKSKIIIITLIAIATLFMTGCSSKKVSVQTSVKEAKTSHVVKTYSKIKLEPIRVVSGILSYKQTDSQKDMYKKIEKYITDGYEKIIKENKKYTLTDAVDTNTLVLHSSISAVEIHQEDKSWNQYTPIILGLNTSSFNVYMYEYVRILGESKLVDSSSNTVVFQSKKIQKEHKIKITGDDLLFEDIQPALDSWLSQVKVDLTKN